MEHIITRDSKFKWGQWLEFESEHSRYSLGYHQILWRGELLHCGWNWGDLSEEETKKAILEAREAYGDIVKPYTRECMETDKYAPVKLPDHRGEENYIDCYFLPVGAVKEIVISNYARCHLDRSSATALWASHPPYILDISDDCFRGHGRMTARVQILEEQALYNYVQDSAGCIERRALYLAIPSWVNHNV